MPAALTPVAPEMKTWWAASASLDFFDPSNRFLNQDMQKGGDAEVQSCEWRSERRRSPFSKKAAVVGRRAAIPPHAIAMHPEDLLPAAGVSAVFAVALRYCVAALGAAKGL